MNAQIEKVKTQGQKVKAHFQRNKKTYLACGGTAVVAVVGTVIVLKSRDSQSMIATQKVLAFKAENITQNVIQTQLPRRGHPGNMVMCNETHIPFSSQNQTAEMMGLSASNLSRHLKGEIPHVKGYTFTKLGEAQPTPDLAA